MNRGAALAGAENRKTETDTMEPGRSGKEKTAVQKNGTEKNIAEKTGVEKAQTKNAGSEKGKAETAGTQMYQAADPGAGNIEPGRTESGRTEPGRTGSGRITLTGILEKDRETLLQKLSASPKPQDAVALLQRECDTMLLSYNEECESERLRKTAASLLQTLSMACGLADSTGKVKVWERADTSRSTSVPEGTISSGRRDTLAWVGGGLLLGGAVLAFLPWPGGLKPFFVLLSLILLAGGGALLFLCGRRIGRSQGVSGQQTGSAAPRKIMTQVRIDPQKVYRMFHQTAQLMDRELEEIQQQEQWEIRQREKEAAGDDGLSREEILLFSELLEAENSRDGEFALEALSQIRYHLHQKGVDVVECTPETQEWFDYMPSMEEGTLRPALVRDGKVLRRGLAGAGGVGQPG